MDIISGNDYTFHFSTRGQSVLGTMGQVDSLAAQGIIDAGFPISVSWHGVDESGSGILSTLGLGGATYFSIAFTYNGQTTDDNSLGNAMQDALNNSNAFGVLSGITVNYESADAGNTTTGLVNQAITGTESAVSTTITAVKKQIPSPTTIGITVILISIVLIAVYSFSGHAGTRLAARA